MLFRSDSFMTKLAGQLRTSSPGAVQLASELLYVYCLVARSDSFSGSKKRAVVDQVLGYADGTTPMPSDLSATLETGFVRTGTAYGSYRHGLFRYLVEFVILIKRLPRDERAALLTDPTAFTTALVALVLNISAYNAETFRAGINSIRKGQMEAALAIGMSRRQAMFKVVIPQAARRILPVFASTRSEERRVGKECPV